MGHKNLETLIRLRSIGTLAPLGMVLFHFLENEHAHTVLKNYWVIQEGSLAMWNWLVSFNPLTQVITRRKLLVLLSGLPIQFWSEDILELIANHLGNFITVQKSALRVGNKRMARVMVELDILEGLSKIFMINWGDKSFN